MAGISTEQFYQELDRLGEEEKKYSRMVQSSRQAMREGQEFKAALI